MESAAGLNAANIAAITLHIVPWAHCALVDTQRGAAMRVVNSLLGVKHSLFGSADLPAPAPGNRPDRRQASVMNRKIS
jgi:hypothetical protein